MNEDNLIAEFTESFDLILNGDLRGLEIENSENKELMAFAYQISKINYNNCTKKSKILKSIFQGSLKGADPHE